MKSFEDKAQESVSVVRTKNADGTAYRLNEAGLTEYHEIGNDEFPTFGDFADVTAIDANGKALGDRWLETPGVLADEFVRIGAEAGTEFRIDVLEKTNDGQWYIEIEEL